MIPNQNSKLLKPKPKLLLKPKKMPKPGPDDIKNLLKELLFNHFYHQIPFY